ncbi:MAG TPA: hypothetical protein VFL34_17830 [Candidatus Sulfotelmatobacter sp.]|nr:hypothetical protein [Candidatus Sulfotelmatobacter sp.]
MIKLSALILGVMFLAGPSLYAQTIPPIKSKALDDSEVILPKLGSPQYLILTIGFSHKSGEQSSAWGKRLIADFPPNDPHVAVYQFAQLQGAPSMIRGMIVHGMHKDVPASQHSHFVPLFDHQDEWKKLVNFSAPDDAYVLFTTPDGHVLWQTHGSVTDASYAALKAAVSSALHAGS